MLINWCIVFYNSEKAVQLKCAVFSNSEQAAQLKCAVFSNSEPHAQLKFTIMKAIKGMMVPNQLPMVWVV